MKGRNANVSFFNFIKQLLQCRTAEGFLEYLESSIEDPRKPRGIRYPLKVILALVIGAILAGNHSKEAIYEWISELADHELAGFGCTFRRWKGEYDRPCKNTLEVVFTKIDFLKFRSTVYKWFFEEVDEETQAIAIDGKRLRGTRTKDQPATEAVGAMAHGSKIVLGGNISAPGTNEITTARELIHSLGDLEGKVITLDALHTQTETAQIIVEEKKADYVLSVKGNQPTLMNIIHEMPDDSFSSWFIDTNRGHGRIDVRMIRVSSCIDPRITFPYANQVFQIQRIRLDLEGNQLKSNDSPLVAGITSLGSEKIDAEGLLKINRGHWGIENSVHWVRDVTCNEDHSQIRRNKGAIILSTLHDVVMNLIRLTGVKEIAKSMRAFSRRTNRVLRFLGLQEA